MWTGHGGGERETMQINCMMHTIMYCEVTKFADNVMRGRDDRHVWR